MEVEPYCMLFKTERQQQEWNSPELDPRLRGIVLAVAEFVWRNYKRSAVITSIWRSDAEQKSIYGEDVKKLSPHQFWRGIDMRTRDYTQDEITGIIAFLNKNWPRVDGKPLVIYHDVGRGDHLHIQVPHKVRPV